MTDDMDLTGNTRRVSVTHDGKPIGWTEPLSREWRGNLKIAKAKKIARSRANGLLKAMQTKGFANKGAIRAAQMRGIARRGA